MACLRVKRCRNEDPSDAIVISLKRQRLSGESTENDEVKTILKLAGTVETKEECIAKHITKAEESSTADRKSIEHRDLKYRSVNVKSKVRRDLNLSSKANRYKIVCCVRGVEEESILAQGDCASAEIATSNAGLCPVYDVEPDASRQSPAAQLQHAVSEDEKPHCDEENYVYDLYYLKDVAGADLNQKLIDIQSYTPNEDSLVYENADDDDDDSSDSAGDYDSNDEGNSRNDYPDEEDDNYEKDYCYGGDGEGLFEQLGEINIDEDEYCYGEDDDDISDDDGGMYSASILKPRKATSLLSQFRAKMSSKDGILTSARSGNPFKQ